jgi:hypothetical protein
VLQWVKNGLISCAHHHPESIFGSYGVFMTSPRGNSGAHRRRYIADITLESSKTHGALILLREQPRRSRPTPRSSEATADSHTRRESLSCTQQKRKRSNPAAAAAAVCGFKKRRKLPSGSPAAGVQQSQSVSAAMAMLLCAWWSNSGPGYRQVADRTHQKVPDGSTGEPGAVTTHKQTDTAFSALIGKILYFPFHHKNIPFKAYEA